MIEASNMTHRVQTGIESFAIDCGHLPVYATASRFQGAGGVAEYHLALRPRDGGTSEVQLAWILEAYALALDSLGIDPQTAIFRRFFCSDLANQREVLEAHPLANPNAPDNPCAVSWIGQPPAPPVKMALWAWHLDDPAAPLVKSMEGSTLTVDRGELIHHWTTGLSCPMASSAYDQTRSILESYESCLRERNMRLADHTVRTWFFVRDVDEDYGMLVRARRELFTDRGLTPATHYIASTGIQGSYVDASTKVLLDAYAIGGLRPEQLTYLSAPTHLSPTHLYGVTFERGVAVAYRDRRHVIISGTASIDAQGKIMHPGDVSRQFDRAVENIDALMSGAGATLADLASILVYIRDPSDHALIWRRCREQFGSVPIQIVVAPVCRPGWLIELEGLAVVPDSNSELPAF
jgi:enamine deaminase RidA (YjgF/YER057c/UK114 family)